jgi:hypothetical protein
MEFCPGTPTAYLATAEQGISILICRLRTGNEMANIQSREQALRATANNHILAEALILGKRTHTHRLQTHGHLLRPVVGPVQKMLLLF